MSNCVNKSSKEFKDCCKRLDVSPATLEPIIHEFINIGGNELSFPSDAYIEERIHGKSIEVLEDAQVKLWEERYSQPKAFDTQEEALNYYNECNKFFPKESIGFKETLDGKYEVRVAEVINTNELEEIKQKAIANGTFMKAPNGNSTNLTERQWLHVRTKAFKRWFGDWENNPENASKVIDENGEPLVVYHESPNKFNTFTFDSKRYDVHEERAHWFSKENREGYGYGENIYPVFLNIKNPRITTFDEIDELTFPQLREKENSLLKDPDSDGVIFETYDKFGAETQFAVKTANQIKSAEYNTGYSEEDNIYYQKTTDKDIYVDFLTNEMLTDFNLKLNKEYTIDGIIKVLPKINLPINETLIRNLLRAASKVGIKYVFETGPDNKTFGMSEGIKIHLYSDPSNPYFVHSLIHETIHSFLSYAIDNPNSEFLTNKQKKALKELEEIFEFIKDKNIDNKFGALNNIQEFVAELANPEVYNKLKEFKVPYKNENFFKKLWLALRDILGIPKTINNEVEDIIQKFLVNPSVYSESHFRMSQPNNRQQELFDEDKESLTQDEIDAKKEREVELDAIFQNTLQLTEQIKELQESDLVTMSEITELSNDIAYYISDLITQWQENPQAFYKNFPSKAKGEVNIQSLTRAELVQYIGVENLLNAVKELLFGEIKEGVNEDKTMLLYDNFEALVRFGANAFGSIEDFQLQYSDIGFTVKENNEIDSLDTEALSNEEQSVIEELGDKQEHWQVDSRTVDNFLTMSQAVKRELARCYQLDSKGNNITNEFGINKRVNPKDATSCILRWTQGSLTLADMIAKLEDKSDSNPWIKPIIEKLKDSSGKYADFQSQFFGVFCKHFQEYYIVKEFVENGTKVMRIMPININPALREVMTSISVLYKMQAHPLFDSNGVNSTKFEEFKKAVNLLKEISKGDFDTLDLERIKKGVVVISNMLGYHTTEDMVELALSEESLKEMLRSLNYIVLNLSKGLEEDNYDPFTYRKDGNGIRGNLRDFLKPLTDVLEDTALSSFYDSGKMYQSYVIPSYMTKLMRKFQNANETEFKQFMEDEYGQYEWFRDQSMDIETASSWKNDWLRRLYGMSLEQRKELFGHKVQLSFMGHNYMRNMSGPEYVLAIMTEFFSGSNDSKEGISSTWYKIPMMSNKPSLEFIKFLRHKGVGYENTILDGFESIFTQELERIITVKNRAFDKKDSRFIKNYDSNGKRFCFLDFMNRFLEDWSDTELGIILNKKINGEKLSIEEETELLTLAREQIHGYMDMRINKIINEYKANGIFEAVKKIDGIGKTDEEIESNLRNFIWNDTFASMMILQMTITDIAYYANAEDLQKRLAQIHAPGIRPNVNATDYQGNRVCDGNLRTIFLNDFEGEDVIQNVIENLEIVFERRIAQAQNDTEKAYWESTKEAIIEAFKEVNVTDAQAYNSPTSYRKKAIMFGKWSSKNEEIYQRLKEGKWNISDIETVFQPLKPFVYTHSTKDSGVGSKLKVGMQFKNAEYALIMADAILRGEDTGKPNLLRAIFEVMEDSAKKDSTKGIDTFMFASAVKAGLHGRINIANFADEKEAKKYIESLIYSANSVDGYNETYVHTFPAEDYSIQQDYSPHFLDHSQAHGSQERYIIPSDLEYTDVNGNPVYYEFEDNGELKRLTADEFRREYEKTIADNIENSIQTLSAELGLDTSNRKLRNIALSKILQKEILSSPRYGMDLYFACSVDSDGNFNIPLGDPIQSKRIEQLINSIVKNRINKQKIAGGPVVQVSNFGLSKRLNIRFKDRNGNILPTLTEWLESNPGKTAKDFKEYLKDNQAGIAYYECYAPAYMQEMFEVFIDEKGFVDIEAIQEIAPEMLEMIGYRIPTEDGYSIAPLRIMGFLPKEAGEALMMPYETTVIWGSDRIVVSTRQNKKLC